MKKKPALEIVSSTPKTFEIMTLDIDAATRATMLDMARRDMPKELIEEAMLSWAFEQALREAIKFNGCKCGDKCRCGGKCGGGLRKPGPTGRCACKKG